MAKDAAAKTKEEKACCQADTNVKIAGAIGGLLIPIFALVLIFAQDQAGILVPITIAMCVMGVLLGFFSKHK